jgi:hypothetical protein
MTRKIDTRDPRTIPVIELESMAEDKNRIRVPNDLCTPLIDVWLRENVGHGGWTEWVGFVNLPYRSFEIHDEQLALLFRLKWL